METWQATIKERGKDSLLTPSYSLSNKFDYIKDKRQREYEIRKFLVNFWGLNNEDIEWYTLEKKKERNEVTNFMYYIYNRWNAEEAKKVFGDNLGEHIYNKFQSYNNESGALYWYSELDKECRQKLVDRANEIYNR